MNIGFIGAGHIAKAMARGWAACPGGPSLHFYDVAPGLAAELAAAARGHVCDSLPGLVRASDLVLVAVRPQHVAEVLAAAGPHLDERGIVSLAAGVTLGRVQSGLPASVRAGRVMPSIAAELRLGVFLYVPGTLGDLASPFEEALNLIGTTLELDEALFDEATAVSGCMPGFMAHIVDSFAVAGRNGGLDEQTATRLAVAAAHGSAALVAKVGDPTAVMAATATPGGMTSAGLARLREDELTRIIENAVTAAAARAKELA